MEVECRPWRAETEVENLWPLDVGIMPLTADAWTAGKCAMKAIQHLGVGAPCSRQPGRPEPRSDRGRGDRPLRTKPSEWVQALERCLDDQGLPERLRMAGRAAIETRYSAEAQAPRLGSLLRSIVE
jgi:hypothetical protein